MQRENKWQDRIKTIFVDNQVYQNIDCIQDLCDLIQSEIDMKIDTEEFKNRILDIQLVKNYKPTRIQVYCLQKKGSLM